MAIRIGKFPMLAADAVIFSALTARARVAMSDWGTGGHLAAARYIRGAFVGETKGSNYRTQPPPDGGSAGPSV